MGTYNAVDNTLLNRELNESNFRVGRRKCDNGTVENSSLHRTSHHSVRKQSGDASMAIVGIGITEVTLEGLPIHGVIGFQESEVWEEPFISVISINSTIQTGGKLTLQDGSTAEYP
jgi:hypothetical protein